MKSGVIKWKGYIPWYTSCCRHNQSIPDVINVGYHLKCPRSTPGRIWLCATTTSRRWRTTTVPWPSPSWQRYPPCLSPQSTHRIAVVDGLLPAIFLSYLKFGNSPWTLYVFMIQFIFFIKFHLYVGFVLIGCKCIV